MQASKYYPLLKRGEVVKYDFISPSRPLIVAWAHRERLRVDIEEGTTGTGLAVDGKPG